MLQQVTHRIRACIMTCVIVVVVPVVAFAQVAQPSGSVDLALKQSQLADRYRQLESLLLKMAEYDSSNNPRRAALLRQALSKGKERQIGGQLDELVKLFQREQLQRAVDGQTTVQTDLKTLLNLLLSENRPDRLKSEQARVRNYIKKLDRIIRQQKSLQGRTEAGEKGERLAKDQNRVADQTQRLGGEIDEAEGTGSPGESQQEAQPDNSETKNQDGDLKDKGSTDKSESNDAESKDADSESSPDERSDSKSDNEKQGDAESKSGDNESSNPDSSKSGKQGERNSDQKGPQGEKSGEEQSGQPGQQQPAQQQPGQQQPGQPQQQDQQFPGRKRIAAAEDRMRQAKQDLEQAKRDDAVEKQEDAKRLLEQAKAELEEILRQLREEEIERVLAMLEGRFRKMLEMELKVQDGTVRLNKTPVAKRTRQFTLRAGKLSLSQRKIVLEVDKALTLLREEGSSVAFPEAVDQMRADMQDVARRLAEEKVGSHTQAIEADIITALEEMIAALQKAQQEAEERRNQPQQQQQQQGDPANQPLVNKIAELKMIRALQMRVNTRTNRFSKMLTDAENPVGQATDDDLLDDLRELSDRQKRIYNVTSDIVLGKNK
jgi:hypothetical protein